MTFLATLIYELATDCFFSKGGSKMIAIKTQTNLRNARKYFREHLSSGDYYSESTASPGTWLGKGASLLCLAGRVRESDFAALCDGLKPDGTKLTKRINTVRKGGVANRRIFYDWTVCPPKSVSIAALVQGDKRIVEAHEAAVELAATELEKHASARVRRAGDPLNGKDRVTGNLLMARFTHETARAIDSQSAPDPLLHTHLIVMNGTLDGSDWKALQNASMLKAQASIRHVYNNALKDSLRSMGYKVRKGRSSWELAHITDATVEKFSKRRSAILAEVVRLRQKGVRESDEALKDRVAHEKRIRKAKGEHAGSLRASWLAQLEGPELELVMPQSVRSGSESQRVQGAKTKAKPRRRGASEAVRDSLFTAARVAGRIEEAIAEAEELEIFR
jgi:conjugative relaxase-like TrwC/TraI family protein